MLPVSASRRFGCLRVGAAESRQATLAVLRRAFELAGVEFIDGNGGGPGVRLRRRQPKGG